MANFDFVEDDEALRKALRGIKPTSVNIPLAPSKVRGGITNINIKTFFNKQRDDRLFLFNLALSTNEARIVGNVKSVGREAAKKAKEKMQEQIIIYTKEKGTGTGRLANSVEVVGGNYFPGGPGGGGRRTWSVVINGLDPSKQYFRSAIQGSGIYGPKKSLIYPKRAESLPFTYGGFVGANAGGFLKKGFGAAYSKGQPGLLYNSINPLKFGSTSDPYINSKGKKTPGYAGPSNNAIQSSIKSGVNLKVYNQRNFWEQGKEAAVRHIQENLNRSISENVNR